MLFSIISNRLNVKLVLIVDMEKLYLAPKDILNGNFYGFGSMIESGLPEEIEYDIICDFCLNELELLARVLTFISYSELAKFLLTRESLKAEILDIEYTIELQKQNEQVLLVNSEDESSSIPLVDFIALALAWFKVSNQNPSIIEFYKEESTYILASSKGKKITISQDSTEQKQAQFIISKYLENKYIRVIISNYLENKCAENALKRRIACLIDTISSYVEKAE